MRGLAMISDAIMFPNKGSHARLHSFERHRQLRLGEALGYPLPRPVQTHPVRIMQSFGFACEPRARWWDGTREQPPVMEWGDFGVFAPLGPLPEHYSESAMQAHAGGCERLQHFVADITQRLAHLYYRGWAQLRPECEAGRPDDRFAELLAALSGAPSARLPYLAWHRPTLAQLPRLALAHCGVSVRVEHPSMSRLENVDALRLGQAHLGRGHLGRHITVFGSRNICLWIEFDSGQQYLAWRVHNHAQRQHFEQLVLDCLPPGGSYQLRFLPPADLPGPNLGCARLGRTRFLRTRVDL
jgi:predicted component of type VI protein secretion system